MCVLLHNASPGAITRLELHARLGESAILFVACAHNGLGIAKSYRKVITYAVTALGSHSALCKFISILIRR